MSAGPSRGLFSSSQIRMMIWAGLLLGLLAVQAARFLPLQAPDARVPFSEAPSDPFAEARRSRTILEAQEDAPQPVGVRTEPGSDLRRGASLRVIDGDTFEHENIRIRIADVDTPELAGRCTHEVELAARARTRLRQLLEAGRFELHPIAGRDRDRYGRHLRIVTRNGQSLGDQLVAEGLARTWTGRREPWC